MDISKEVGRLRTEAAGIEARIKWLIDREHKLAALPDVGGYYHGSLDFDHLSHSEIVKVIEALGGKWAKTPASELGKINYEAEIDGMLVRCWCGEPPPSCKLVEIEEHVPEQVIPAHTVKLLKMECKPALDAVEAVASTIGVEGSATEPL